MNAARMTLADRVAAQPLYQAVIVFGLGIVLSLLDNVTQVPGIGTTSKNSTWVLMTACILFYSIFSSILSLKVKDPNRYWRDAILSYIGLMICSALFAWLLTGVTIDEAGSFRWLFLVLTFGYLVFLSIIRLMRRIVEIAIRQDEKLRGGGGE